MAPGRSAVVLAHVFSLCLGGKSRIQWIYNVCRIKHKIKHKTKHSIKRVSAGLSRMKCDSARGADVPGQKHVEAYGAPGALSGRSSHIPGLSALSPPAPMDLPNEQLTHRIVYQHLNDVSRIYINLSLLMLSAA
jgi:hypothetical protein